MECGVFTYRSQREVGDSWVGTVLAVCLAVVEASDVEEDLVAVVAAAVAPVVVVDLEPAVQGPDCPVQEGSP